MCYDGVHLLKTREVLLQALNSILLTSPQNSRHTYPLLSVPVVTKLCMPKATSFPSISRSLRGKKVFISSIHERISCEFYPKQEGEEIEEIKSPKEGQNTAFLLMTNLEFYRTMDTSRPDENAVTFPPLFLPADTYSYIILIALLFIPIRFLHTIDLKEPRRARISLPIEIILGLACAFQIEPALFARGAVRERNMVVCDIFEEVDFFLLEE